MQGILPGRGARSRRRRYLGRSRQHRRRVPGRESLIRHRKPGIGLPERPARRHGRHRQRRFRNRERAVGEGKRVVRRHKIANRRGQRCAADPGQGSRRRRDTSRTRDSGGREGFAVREARDRRGQRGVRGTVHLGFCIGGNRERLLADREHAIGEGRERVVGGRKIAQGGRDDVGGGGARERGRGRHGGRPGDSGGAEGFTIHKARERRGQRRVRRAVCNSDRGDTCSADWCRRLRPRSNRLRQDAGFRRADD